MSRPCTICQHSQREAIDRALIEGIPLRKTALRFGISDAALLRHKNTHLLGLLARARQRAELEHRGEAALGAKLLAYQQQRDAREDRRAFDLLAELRACLEGIRLLFDACDRWLRDPEDPSRYEIGPRAEDVMVTYLEPAGDGGGARRRALLSHLLARGAGAGEVTRVELRCADPRRLLVQAAARLQAQLQLLDGLAARLPAATVPPLREHPEWLPLRDALLKALKPFPDACLAAGAAIEPFEADSPEEAR